MDDGPWVRMEGLGGLESSSRSRSKNRAQKGKEIYFAVSDFGVEKIKI